MIKVYSTDSCSWCVKVKQYLKLKNIDFEDVNVQRNMSGKREMIEKTHQLGVPVIDINGTIIVGFDRSAIDDALNL